MELEKTWQEFASLSPEAQGEVADLITLLKERDRPSKQITALGQIAWRSQPFVGMWKDRKDLEDSSQWVRAVRRQEWSNIAPHQAL